MNKDEGHKSEHRLNAGARVIITAGAEVAAGKPKVKTRQERRNQTGLTSTSWEEARTYLPPNYALDCSGKIIYRARHEPR